MDQDSNKFIENSSVFLKSSTEFRNLIEDYITN